MKIEPGLLAQHLALGIENEAECELRASLLADDIAKIGFEEFRLSSQCYPYRIPITGSVVSKHLAEYHFGETGFSVDKAVNADDNPPIWRGGAGLDRGHLQFFSKVSRLGHLVIPDLWLSSPGLRRNLRNPTLEEVWWLGRWKEIKKNGVRMAVKLSAACKGDVDWQIELPRSGFTVNLEVKRAKFDFDAHSFAGFCGKYVLPKFLESSAKEINILGLTLIAQMFRPFYKDAASDVHDILQQWLFNQSKVDAILVTARGHWCENDVYFHYRNRKAYELRDELLPWAKEDAAMWFPMEITYPIPGFPR